MTRPLIRHALRRHASADRALEDDGVPCRLFRRSTRVYQDPASFRRLTGIGRGLLAILLGLQLLLHAVLVEFFIPDSFHRSQPRRLCFVPILTELVIARIG